MFKHLQQKKISKLIMRRVQQALIETVRALPLARKERACNDAFKDARFA
jgi:hypothetical protein